MLFSHFHTSLQWKVLISFAYQNPECGLFWRLIRLGMADIFYFGPTDSTKDIWYAAISQSPMVQVIPAIENVLPNGSSVT
jgi:hypothetical protein